MKKIWKILLIIIGIIGLIVLIYFLSRPKPMNKFVFPDSVIVNNYTKFEIDTVVKVLINKIFNQDSIIMNIYYMNHEMTYEDFKIMAFIYPLAFNNKYYMLFLDESISGINSILCHEFIHFDQYVKGELILNKDTKVAIYKGDTIFLEEVSYNLRPFEKDAYNRQYEVSKQLNSLLYK